MPHTVSQIIKYRKKVLLIDQRNHKGCLLRGQNHRDFTKLYPVALITKLLCIQLKKSLCLSTNLTTFETLFSPFLHGFLLLCFAVFCLVFCLFSAMCSDFFLPCFPIADEILTRDFLQIRFCA